jgi:hypothetical protein
MRLYNLKSIVSILNIVRLLEGTLYLGLCGFHM